MEVNIGLFRIQNVQQMKVIGAGMGHWSHKIWPLLHYWKVNAAQCHKLPYQNKCEHSWLRHDPSQLVSLVQNHSGAWVCQNTSSIRNHASRIQSWFFAFNTWKCPQGSKKLQENYGTVHTCQMGCHCIPSRGPTKLSLVASMTIQSKGLSFETSITL